MDLNWHSRQFENRRRNGIRFWLGGLVGLLVSGVIYSTFFSNVPERDFTALWKWGQNAPTYTLYTGPKGGTYAELAQRISDSYQGGAFWLKIVPTNGSLDNAVNVSTTRGAFTFVTEPLVAGLYQAQGPPLQRIAPLYMQRAFVAYNKDRWKAFRASHCRGGLESLRLTGDKPSCAYRYLVGARWDTGPLGGGGRLVATHLLHAADLRPAATESSLNVFEQAVKIRKGTVDVAICFAGDENALFAKVRAAVQEGAAGGSFPALGITGVDTELIAAPLSIDLRPTAFTNEEGDQVETLGAYAVLIASADIPPEHVAAFVREAARFVQDMAARLGATNSAGTHLDNVAAVLEAAAQDRRAHLWAVLAQFLCIAGASFLFAGNLSSALDSRGSREKFMQRHSNLIERLRAGREGGERGESALRFLQDVAGELDETLVQIHHRARYGRLSLPHRDQLLTSAAGVRGELRRQFALRLKGASQEVAFQYGEWLQKSGYSDLEPPVGRPS